MISYVRKVGLIGDWAEKGVDRGNRREGGVCEMSGERSNGLR